MKCNTTLCGVAIAAILQLGALAGSAQADIYWPSGSERNVTLDPGTYIITAYGAAGGRAGLPYGSVPPGAEGVAGGGGGAEMSAEFNFSSPTTLTLLVGDPGGSYFRDFGSVGGGGGGSFVVQGSTPLVVAGGGGGAVANLSAGAVAGGNATVSTYGGTGGGSAGGRGGANGSGGDGGDTSLFGGVRSGIAAGGGSGFYTDGGPGFPYYGSGGGSFESGGAGGYDDTGYGSAGGGFGGGGGGSWGGSHGFPNDFFGGGGGGYSGGGGGGEAFHTGECDAGGGGGSFIDSSAIATLAEVAGTPLAGPFQVGGEIVITAVPEPASASLLAIASLVVLRRRVRRRSALK